MRDSRPPTRAEDAFLRNAAKRASKIVAPGKLVLVDARAPTRCEAALLRPKQAAHVPGQLQCPRCGGRQWCVIYAGGDMNPETKRISHKTVLHDSICAICWQNGSVIPMSILV